MDNKKLASMCPVPPTLRELLKKQKELEMQEKEKYFKHWINKKHPNISVGKTAISTEKRLGFTHLRYKSSTFDVVTGLVF